MGIMDILGRYGGEQNHPPPQVTDDFEQVAQQVPPDSLSTGLEHAFRSDATPPFEQMVRHLFERSDGAQRAGLLNEILGSLPQGAAGGILGNILSRGRTVTPEQARDVSPSEVESAATQAAQHNPDIISAVSRFYAQHPQLVQTLGTAALSVAMSAMARRRGS
ncbi:MAG: hypothetical protein ACM3SO_23155 [Betaproteobacteria bacterium]